MENEIEIYYRWCSVDKGHEYSVVCKERSTQANYCPNAWIYWIWYKMGEEFTEEEKESFDLLPFANTWDEKCKLIKKYKDCNSGYRFIVKFIRRHFKNLPAKKKLQ